MNFRKFLAGLLATITLLSLITENASAYRDLETGVFVQRDPAGMVNGPNLYTYVNQNPWTFFDPLGLALSMINGGASADTALYHVSDQRMAELDQAERDSGIQTARDTYIQNKKQMGWLERGWTSFRDTVWDAPNNFERNGWQRFLHDGGPAVIDGPAYSESVDLWSGGTKMVESGWQESGLQSGFLDFAGPGGGGKMALSGFARRKAMQAETEYLYHGTIDIWGQNIRRVGLDADSMGETWDDAARGFFLSPYKGVGADYARSKAGGFSYLHGKSYKPELLRVPLKKVQKYLTPTRGAQGELEYFIDPSHFSKINKNAFESVELIQ